MKKKLMISLLVVCVLLPAALSAAVLDLSLGVTAQYKDSLGTIKTAIDADNFDGLADFENYALGADVRFKLLIAEVDLVGKFSQETLSSVDYTKIEVLTTAGVSMDLLGFARLGFGMGPNWIVRMDDDGKFTIFDANDAPQTLDSLGETFINSPVAYRATLDFNLGSLMLGLNYTLETDYTFKKAGEVDKLFNANMDDGTVGVSLLFSLL
ncbi:MAG: hypothetical protein PHY87_07935 [Sphaerochaeta sp.]|uniref:hypothetical protein n=1 Tax=Sphaerochaeta sp. TaxID=1972642 RepID=UPI001DED1903|nr:hypothetical protein [uncultured Sphaerochaeta sp.]MDD3929711.1 hypothetical protein [Sphaerochaeta sp.]NCC13553.1 hypothetical protein [Spirochaetia bacterium]NCC88978.1 hypothetical protein [Spirochaetia bacterium]